MRKLFALVTLTALPLAQGCAVHQDSTPSTTSGPSETALSLRMTATPDALFQDGNQSARVAITAFDAAGHPGGVSPQLQADIKARAARQLTHLDGSRHVEVFIASAS